MENIGLGLFGGLGTKQLTPEEQERADRHKALAGRVQNVALAAYERVVAELEETASEMTIKEVMETLSVMATLEGALKLFTS